MKQVVIFFKDDRWISVEIDSADDVFTDQRERVLTVKGSKMEFQVNWDSIRLIAFPEDEEQNKAVVELLA